MHEVQRAFAELSDQERELINALYYEQLTQSEYASRIGVTQQYVSKTKKKILKKLKFFWKRGCKNSYIFPYTSEKGRHPILT